MFSQLMLLISFIILNRLFWNVPVCQMGLEKKKFLHALTSFFIIEVAFIISFYILSKSAINESLITFVLLDKSKLKYFVFVWIVVAPIEEIAFRGILFNKLISKFGDGSWFKAGMVSSVIFGLGHLIIGKPFLNAIIFGILFCIIYKITGNLYFVMMLHALSHGVIGFELIPKPIGNVNIQYASALSILLLIVCNIFYLKRIHDKSKVINSSEANMNMD